MTLQEWEVEVARLESVLHNLQLPTEMEIMSHSKIHNVRQYVDVNLLRAKASPGNIWNIGPLLRLQEIEKILKG